MDFTRYDVEARESVDSLFAPHDRRGWHNVALADAIFAEDK